MVALLLACFALLDAISMLYIALLCCLHTSKSQFHLEIMASTCLFACFHSCPRILCHLEEHAICQSQTSSKAEVHCNDCWQSSSAHLRYCESRWLGLTIDAPRVLISMLACLKPRADHRNVLKATIEVPHVGEVNFQCTHLDHLNENWRMKQVGAIIQSSDSPHILAGGLNSLDETDYSQERWTDIVKYYEEMGKPTPEVEVMRFLKSKQYRDAKDFNGECESVVVIAKGQSVQGTCKYGTRVDYILASPDCPYKFNPGSYLVLSSKGTLDHHIVKVDVMKCENNPPHESNGNNNKITKKRR